MADFESPSGPPPPKVPEGWVARWNSEYKEWFFVNTFTKKSQWEKPTEPARPPADDGAPSGPPPSYTPGDKPVLGDVKTNPFINASTGNAPGASSADESEDSKLARKLQAEEDAKNRSGSAASYAAGTGSHSNSGSPFPDQLPPRDGNGDKQRGFLGKLFGKNKMSGGSHGYPGSGYQQPYQGYGQPQYGGAPYGGGPPQQYGGYPPQGGYGGYPPQGGYYQQGPPGGYQGGGMYPQQQQYNNRPSGGGGLGMAGGAALGLGAGLIGGMVLENALDNHEQEAYNEGYQDGGGGDDYGGDF